MLVEEFVFLTFFRFLVLFLFGLKKNKKGQGRHFNFFLGPNFFYLFFNATGHRTIEKLQKNSAHFICSNLTLFIITFFFPKFSRPNENVVDLSDVGVAGSLLLTA